MSEFINRSKHAAMTAIVEQHFNTGGSNSAALGLPKGGSGAWNGQPVTDFNSGSGVNYVPPGNAGHTTTQAPFSGQADGLPGNSKVLWDK